LGLIIFENMDNNNHATVGNLGTKWLEVDLAILQQNCHAIQNTIGPQRKIIAVIKADAYGHGAVECARTFLQAGAGMLAVSSLDEALQLRQEFIKGPILVFGSIPRNQIFDIINYNLTSAICDLEFAQALNARAGELQKKAYAHVCVDTGMGRIGPRPAEIQAWWDTLVSLPNVILTGIYTHFASADNEETGFREEQLSRFQNLCHSLGTTKLNLLHHCAASGAILRFPGSYQDAVRPGLALYGIYPAARKPADLNLEQALSLKCRVIYKKKIKAGETVSYNQSFQARQDTWIATLPVGYADGFSRKFQVKGTVLIRGRRHPLAGAVCMDMMMVDLGPETDVALDDEVVILGRQGTDEISVYDMAAGQGTIPYEIITRFGRRLPILYTKSGQAYSLQKIVNSY
jgi:alanine racemase